ncbi:hypothetical protein DLJ59_06255 [Micromonospora inaquosa]|uniref:Uncharacterized protein n=1 Tax=Micromonospora inaquosa TaxID=2203716 RepID=A0A3N9WYM3_9ACTN|nr:hypothetical protein DLJ59_06255 [Micromonospora inaquosa]
MLVDDANSQPPFSILALHLLLASAGMWMDDLRRYRAAEVAYGASAHLAAEHGGAAGEWELSFSEHQIRFHAARSAMLDSRPDKAQQHCQEAVRTALIHGVPFATVAYLTIAWVELVGEAEPNPFCRWLVGELHAVATRTERVVPELQRCFDSVNERTGMSANNVVPPSDAAEWRALIDGL